MHLDHMLIRQPQPVVGYVVPLVLPDAVGSFSVAGPPLEASAFRPAHLRTSIDDPGCVELTAVRVGTQNQLIMPVDACAYSLNRAIEAVERFVAETMKKYKLKTRQQYENWMDDHEWSEPDPCRFDMFTISRDGVITVEGRILKAANGGHRSVMITGSATGVPDDLMPR